DSTTEIAPPPKAILERARRLGIEPEHRKDLPSSGYYVLRNRECRIIADAGSIGPSYLTAHSHADTLTYEMSVSGVTIVTDTGVFEYQEGDARTHDRSTRAHNTVVVDGTDQAECWSSFRVGRRFPPVDVHRRSTDGLDELTGCFRGYEVLIGDDIRHERTFSVSEQSGVTITDLISGHGEHLIETAVHLHPDVDLAQSNEGLLLSRDGASCVFSSASPYFIEQRPYSPRFGLRLMRPTIVIRVETDLPIEVSYEFRTP
ncbi:MAG: heparinase II/III-family protein, partial [Rhodothermia bacterium]|nr:heparinase II/III-family protein [Rhodothermia bacterium]